MDASDLPPAVLEHEPPAQATAHDWAELLPFLRSLRLPEDARTRLEASIRHIQANTYVLEPLSGGRWRIGQGSSTCVLDSVPASLPIAYEALQGREARFTGTSDDAMRNQLKRAARRIEGDSPLLAKRLRLLRVSNGRVTDPYAGYASLK
jgi:hypothetical protein